jgi:hypothetical protein
MSTSSPPPGDGDVRHGRLRFAGPLIRATRAFAAAGFPITWRSPAHGTFDIHGVDAAVVHVEMTGGSLLLAVYVDAGDEPAARHLGSARLGPSDGDTATVYTELPLTPSTGDADVRRAVSALLGALRTRSSDSVSRAG